MNHNEQNQLERKQAEALIEDYLDRMCKQIRARALHPELRDEIRIHIEELASVQEEAGNSPIEAATWALDQMGDAKEVGSSLGQIHRPKFNWLLLIPVGLMMGLGLLALFSLGAAGQGVYERFNPGLNQLFYFGLSIIAFVVGVFFNYRWLQKFAVPLYLATFAFSAVAFFLSDLTMNGLKGWIALGSFIFDWKTCMLLLFLLTLPGIFQRLQLQNKASLGFRQVLALVAFISPISLCVYFQLTLSIPFAIYIVAAATLYVRSGAARLYVYGLPVVSLAGMMVLYFRNEHWQARLHSVLNPQSSQSYSTNRYYVNDWIASAIREGGWFGQGFGTEVTKRIATHADFILPYFTYIFGWIAASILILCMAWLIVLLTRTVQKITDSHGKLVALGLVVFLAGQWIYAIGASFNVLPTTVISVPFIGYEGSMNLIYFGIFGLILGIYRRKDMIPTQAISQTSSPMTEK
ncbi:FtsW/RodA/SpoVE family cell cycle protein [Saccharibacillus sp. JS10]|uniref:FtsW/RodA/SpoVE family cell cycle protein n=1 Tax=Saccharibacillus sp. JS10 TaxID=2950552 RepID=UPI00210C68C7|nr:FtsW/RodA/SpoVE family cell cycle protein [Saccharibacillus sp. JS10]MCQ4087524.1 FtsW/RodA/SpoVE family cell cycle protein [Saccharibacillus sp. JS10]